MGASLVPYLRHLPNRQVFPALFFICDESWAAALADAEQKKRFFESVEAIGKIDCKYCMPYEDNKVVYLCRNAKASVSELWPQIKHYD